MVLQFDVVCIEIKYDLCSQRFIYAIALILQSSLRPSWYFVSFIKTHCDRHIVSVNKIVCFRNRFSETSVQYHTFCALGWFSNILCMYFGSSHSFFSTLTFTLHSTMCSVDVLIMFQTVLGAVSYCLKVNPKWTQIVWKWTNVLESLFQKQSILLSWHIVST